MLNLDFKYRDAVEYLEKEIPFIPETAVILGSGLGDFAHSIELIKSISTKDITGYPPSTVVGHEGKLHFAKYQKKQLLLFQGRIHFYEGYPIDACVLPSFLSYRLGCKSMLITNAAGGINPLFHPGDLMLITSFNGINIKKELTGVIKIASPDEHNKNLDFPSKILNEKIQQAAVEERITLKEGVYWYSKGPVYETPSEIRMMHKFGGDAVGMSTVLEGVFASYKGLKVSAISCITNYAAGISTEKLSHDEVTETASMVREKFERLLKKSIELI